MLRVALGRQLSGCPLVKTLGVRANMSDYTPGELELIRAAGRIYFPTFLFVDALHAMGKAIFPSIHTYLYTADKLKQTVLFQMLGVPIPRTRVYFGALSHKRILEEFEMPFVAKIPRGSSMGEGVFLIRNKSQLDSYLAESKVAYIQQYLPVDRDIRVIILGRKVVFSYWKVAKEGEFRTNVAQGGRIVFDPVPEEAVALARDVAKRCGFDHVGLDILKYKGAYFVLEANMVFGRKAMAMAGLCYKGVLRSLVERGEI